MTNAPSLEALIADAPLELNKENVEKGLLQYNYFPRSHDHKEEMPAFFNSEKFLPAIAQKILGIDLSKDRRKSGYDLMPYRRTRHPNIPRMMGIPHPRAYAELVKILTDNWGEHILDKCQSQNSNLTFEIQPDFRIIVHSYNRISVDGEVENKDPSLDFGMEYRIKTDITNFYHSIYSHSLPWALVGHQKAKRERDIALWFNQIDWAARLCQRNETKGIPIGPATSSILSELILSRVDETLREKYRFSRYIDDYTAFTKTRGEANQFLVDLSRELEKYALNLNPKKTHISEMPRLAKEKWVSEINIILSLQQKTAPDDAVPEKINIRQLRLLLDRAVLLSEEYPDGSVLKYAFSAILETGVQGNEAEEYLQDMLLKYAYHYPALIPVIHRWLGQYPFAFEISDRLYELFRHSLKQGQSDNIVWCVSYLIRNGRWDQTEVLKECCDDGAPMVMLMGYIFAKKTSKDISQLKKWADEKIAAVQDGSVDAYDIDRYWLLFYQLYLDCVIEKPPYKEGLDNKIFELLKAEKISFVDYEHEDLKTLPEKIFAPVREKLASIKPSNRETAV